MPPAAVLMIVATSVVGVSANVARGSSLVATELLCRIAEAPTGTGDVCFSGVSNTPCTRTGEDWFKFDILLYSRASGVSVVTRSPNYLLVQDL